MNPTNHDTAPLDLVPRYKHGGYTEAEVDARRLWIERRIGATLQHVGSRSIAGREMRGNIENPIGTVQMPIGIAGPLVIHGQQVDGAVYVPLATTEGALVRSYERGMVAITRSGGATVRVIADQNRVCPVFMFDDVAAAHRFATELPAHFAALATQSESTTRHGKLLRVEPSQIGREVVVAFCFHTGDAHGMNMIVRATENACRWILARGLARDFYVFSGVSSEKRASGSLFTPGKGKRVVAGACIRREVARSCLHVTPDQLARLWHHTVVGHLYANAIGFNAQYANGLAAMFIACGQDVANIANSSVGLTNFEVTSDGDLYASVTLPSLVVGTVGGGTALGTSHECLSILGCTGSGSAVRFAEIAAAALLGGELSMAAAIASGEFVQAHERYGRNRPFS
jgi:hydroxymethylglutaryl-CoA reductase (NADPH)